MTGAERLDRRKKTLRRMTVTRYLWMFLTVAATVVGASILDETQTVQATIEAVATADSVMYRAYWSVSSDLESSVKMMIEIESQFGTKTMPLTESNREGVFSSLRSGTMYRVRVLQEDSIGNLVLATTSVRTTNQASGAVAVSFPQVEVYPGEIYLRPTIQALFSDPHFEYTAWRIRYKVLWQPVTSEDILNPSGYQTTPIAASGDVVELTTLYPMNQSISVYLEAQDSQGSWQTIEHRLVATPLSFSASMYVTALFPDAIAYYAYVSDSNELGAVFWTELRRDGILIDKQGILPSEDFGEPSPHWFRGLTRETDYSIRLMVRYVDPVTKSTVTQVLSDQAFRTPPMYRIRASSTIEGNHIILTLEVEDPRGLLSEFEYTVFNHEHHEYISGPIVLTDLGNGTKRAVISIDFTQIGPKTVSITALLQLDSQTSMTTSLYHDIVE